MGVLFVTHETGLQHHRSVDALVCNQQVNGKHELL